MRLSKWTLFCALLLTAALSLTGCMNAGDRGAAPSSQVLSSPHSVL